MRLFKLTFYYWLWVLFCTVSLTAVYMLAAFKTSPPWWAWLTAPTVFLLLTLPPFTLLRHELREWNNGICARNGLKWKLRDQDSQGGRMYCAGKEVIWISWLKERSL